MNAQQQANSNFPFTRPSFMNRPKAEQGQGLVFGNASVYYDLAAVGAVLEVSAATPVQALQAARRTARFAFRNGPVGLALVDERMGFAVTLSTALKTGAVYEGLDLSKPSSLRCVGGEFFREYLRFLVQPSLTLLHRRGYNFNWPNLGLVLHVVNGAPVGLGFFSRAAVASMDYTQPLLISPGNSDCSGTNPGGPSFGLYKNYAEALLTCGLRPLVAELAAFGVRAEVLWDIAIETLLETAQSLGLSPEAQQQLFTTELTVVNLNKSQAAHSNPDTIAPKAPRSGKGFSFNQGQIVFLKQHCCEKYRKKERCSNCPGNRKSGPARLPLSLV